MRTCARALALAALVAALSATSAAQHPSHTTAAVPARAAADPDPARPLTFDFVIFSTAEGDDLARDFADGETRATLDSAHFLRLAATGVARRSLRPEARMMSVASSGAAVLLADADRPQEATRTLRAEITAGMDGAEVVYSVALDAGGPRGGLRSNFTLREDQTAVFRLPSNFTADAEPAPGRAYFAAFTVTPSARPHGELARSLHQLLAPHRR